MVVTSSSHSQLEKQLFTNIRKYKGHPIFKSWDFLSTEVKTPQGGFIQGISIDNPKAGEGYHEEPDAPLMFLADEAKSIDDSIFTAFDRCSSSFKCYASSAGGSAGAFYRCFSDLRDYWSQIVVTSSDCPHIPRERIEQDRAMMGADSDEFRSKHRAEFVDSSGRSIISAENVRLAVDTPPPFTEGPTAWFVDWAWSSDGDATVVSRWTGNKGEIISSFRDNPTQTVRRVAAILRDHNVREVTGDADGGGVLANGQLYEAAGKQVNVTDYHNGAASDPDIYNTKAAELWTLFNRDLEQRKLILPSDGELSRQLTNRLRSLDEKSRVRIEPKKAMRARGVDSPDKADSLICAWNAARVSDYGADFAEKVNALVAKQRRDGAGQSTMFGQPFPGYAR